MRLDIDHPQPSSKVVGVELVDLILREVPVTAFRRCKRQEVNESGSFRHSEECNMRTWYSPPMAERPPEYEFGPLQGSQTQLARWITGHPDRRRIHRLAKCGTIWVRRIHKRLCEVWFRSERRYAVANLNAIDELGDSL